MARFDRLTVLNEMLNTGLVRLFYHSDHAVAKDVVTACSKGSARVLEFTNRGDKAIQVFSRLVEFVESAQPGLIPGVGLVLDAPTAGKK